MPHSLAARFAIGFLLFVSGLAMWKGRTPERIVGAGAVVNELVFLLVYHPFDAINPQYEAMIIDAVFAGVIGYVAIKWNRGWAKWATAFEMLIVGTHLAVALDLRIAAAVGQWSAAFWTMAVLWALLIGTLQVILEDRRRKRAPSQST